MNKDDIMLLHVYLSDKDLPKELAKLRDKIALIKSQIEAQDKIQDIQKKLAEMDKIDKEK